MDFDKSTISSGFGLLLVFLFLMMICICCKRRQVRLQLNQPNVNQPAGDRPRGQGRRQKNARRKWRRRRQHEVDQGRVVILEHEAPYPVSAAPGQNPHCHPPPQAHNPQCIINLNPPSQMPFQAGHFPPPGPFPAQQPHWQQQVLHSSQYPPQHFNVPLPQDVSYPAPNMQQQQPGGFAQLYAQAQPDMNVFPQPPPPYETEPFPPLPPKQK